MRDQSIAGIWRRRWVRYSVYGLVLVAVVLISLPFAARYYLEHWLVENGADQADIKDIDINLFTGAVELKGANVKIGGRTVIADSDIDIDVALSDFFSRQATVQRATLDGVHLEIEAKPDGTLRIGSVDLGGGAGEAEKPDTTGKKRPWWFKITALQLTNSTVRYISPEFTSDISLQRVVVEDFFTGPADTPARIELKGQLDGAPVSLTGTLLMNMPKLESAGELTLTGLDASRYAALVKSKLQALAGKIDVNGQYAFALADGKLASARYDGALGVAATEVAMEALQSKLANLSWQGNFELAEGGRAVSIDGKLDLSEPQVKTSDLETGAGGLSWQGKVGLAENGKNIAVDGKLHIAAPAVNTEAVQSKAGTVSWQGKVGLAAGDDGGRNIDIDGTLAGADLGVEFPTGKQRAELGQLDLKPMLKLRLGADKLDGAGDLGIHAENISATLPEQGISHSGGVLDANGKINFATKGGADGKAIDWGIQFPEITLAGNSTVEFSMADVEPPVSLQAVITKFSIKDIDSASPDKPANFEVAAEIGKYGKLEAEGSVKPFAKDLFVDAEAKLDNFPMVPLSPLSVKHIGHIVQSGQLELESKTAIENGAIDSQNKVVLNRFHVRKVEGEAAQKTEKDLGMPMDKALGMLRDKNDNIKLDVPITGKLEEIDVGYGSIINIVLKKALKKGTMSYLLYAFQPYGALIYLGQKAGEAASKISLDPVEFPPGGAELTDKHKDYLQKLVKVMKDREQVSVQVCSFVTAADALIASGKKPPKPTTEAGETRVIEVSAEMKQQAIKLAAARAEAIKAFLVDQHGIDPGRLSVCAPEYDDKPDAKPRVELLI